MSNKCVLQERKALRLNSFDYSQSGAYFVTICTQNCECLFGEVVNNQMVLNNMGNMVQSVWKALPSHYPHVVLDAFVIMPNHVHGIVFIDNYPVGDAPRGVPLFIDEKGLARGPAPTDPFSLPDAMHRFKSLTTAKYRHGIQHNGWPPFNRKLWQRGYYDHIIRNEADLSRTREYIANNLTNWAEDSENPMNLKS